MTDNVSAFLSIESAWYLEGQGGLWLSNNVVVRERGSEVLPQDLPHDLEWLVVNV